MHCIYCGEQISEGARFCAHCGKPQPGNSSEHVSLPEANDLTGNGANEVNGSAAQADGVFGQANAATGNERVVGEAGNRTLIVMGVTAALALAVFGGIYLHWRTTGHLPFGSLTLPGIAGANSQNEPINHQAGPSPSDDIPIVNLGEASVGDVVRMGRYPLDESYGEPIDWIVLDEQGDHLLLLSHKGIDCRPISMQLHYDYDITWEKSDIRSWLNGSFLDSFDDDDLDRIDTTIVSTSRDGDVPNKVFLLDMNECSTYVTGSMMCAYATPYAIDRGAHVSDDDGTVIWWLRDYNMRQDLSTDDNAFAMVFYDGRMIDPNQLATTDGIAVRPAMWVNRNGMGVTVDFSTGVFQIEGDSSETNDGPIDVSPIADEPIAEDSTDSVPPSSYLGESTAYLEVEAQDGSILSGYVRRDDDEYVIRNSSEYEYSMAELEAMNLSDAELCIAWNEPFARQGYHFKNSGLQEYFGGCSWYVDSGKTFTLTGAGAHNNALLRELAERSASGRQWESLATH